MSMLSFIPRLRCEVHFPLVRGKNVLYMFQIRSWVDFIALPSAAT